LPAPATLVYLPLLKKVSRSFYLTVRILPSAIRPQIGVAYLLARATDTIADTEIVPVQQRLEMLARLRDRILATRKEPLNTSVFVGSATPGERALLERIESILGAMKGFSAADQERIRNVLKTIVSGQELDLVRFGDATRKNLCALSSAEELDDYTYRVAGCVGEFWTKISRAHLFPEHPIDERKLFAQAAEFGKGLQLVNVLRDLPRDLWKGRCYLPSAELAASGLKPENLLDTAAEPQLRPVYDKWLDQGIRYLTAGWEYTNSLPRRCFRLRLACAWPILIGAETLEGLRSGPILDPELRIKLTRKAVRQIIVQSILLYPFPALWRNQLRPNSS